MTNRISGAKKNDIFKKIQELQIILLSNYFEARMYSAYKDEWRDMVLSKCIEARDYAPEAMKYKYKKVIDKGFFDILDSDYDLTVYNTLLQFVFVKECALTEDISQFKKLIQAFANSRNAKYHTRCDATLENCEKALRAIENFVIYVQNIGWQYISDENFVKYLNSEGRIISDLITDIEKELANYNARIKKLKQSRKDIYICLKDSQGEILEGYDCVIQDDDFEDSKIALRNVRQLIKASLEVGEYTIVLKNLPNRFKALEPYKLRIKDSDNSKIVKEIQVKTIDEFIESIKENNSRPTFKKKVNIYIKENKKEVRGYSFDIVSKETNSVCHSLVSPESEIYLDSGTYCVKCIKSPVGYVDFKEYTFYVSASISEINKTIRVEKDRNDGECIKYKKEASSYGDEIKYESIIKTNELDKLNLYTQNNGTKEKVNVIFNVVDEYDIGIKFCKVNLENKNPKYGKRFIKINDGKGEFDLYPGEYKVTLDVKEWYEVPKIEDLIIDENVDNIVFPKIVIKKQSNKQKNLVKIEFTVVDENNNGSNCQLTISSIKNSFTTNVAISTGKGIKYLKPGIYQVKVSELSSKYEVPAIEELIVGEADKVVHFDPIVVSEAGKYSDETVGNQNIDDSNESNLVANTISSGVIEDESELEVSTRNIIGNKEQKSSDGQTIFFDENNIALDNGKTVDEKICYITICSPVNISVFLNYKTNHIMDIDCNNDDMNYSSISVGETFNLIFFNKAFEKNVVFKRPNFGRIQYDLRAVLTSKEIEESYDRLNALKQLYKEYKSYAFKQMAVVGEQRDIDFLHDCLEKLYAVVDVDKSDFNSCYLLELCSIALGKLSIKYKEYKYVSDLKMVYSSHLRLCTELKDIIKNLKVLENEVSTYTAEHCDSENVTLVPKENISKSILSVEDCYKQGLDSYNRSEFDKALKMFSKSHEQGFIEATYYLGVMYAKGKGVVQDFEKAYYYFVHAAENNNILACYKAGLCCLYGNGTEKNYSKAICWLSKVTNNSSASEAELNPVYEALGDAYSAIGDYEKALDYYKKVTSPNKDIKNRISELLKKKTLMVSNVQFNTLQVSNHKDNSTINLWFDNKKTEYGIFNLNNSADNCNLDIVKSLVDEDKMLELNIVQADYFSNYLDLASDCAIEGKYDQALEYLFKIKNPNDEVLEKIGCVYYVLNQYEEAAKYLEKPAQSRHMSKIIMSQIYASIDYTKWDFIKGAKLMDTIDYVEEEYLSFNKYIHSMAQKQKNGKLGEEFYLMSHNEYSNCEYRKGLAYTRVSAQLEYAKAQYDLGKIYEMGELVTRDYNQALSWYQKAMDKDLADAFFSAACLYYFGYLGKTNYRKAYVLCRLAADKGCFIAKKEVAKYRKAFEDEENSIIKQGDYNRIKILADNYYYGNEGYDIDYAMAFKYYSLILDHFNGLGYYMIGTMYMKGLGVVKDLTIAEDHFIKAGVRGNKKAVEMIIKLKNK